MLFRSMEQLPFKKQDLYKFILLVLFSLGECTHFINILNQEEFTHIVLSTLKPYGQIIGVKNLIQDLYSNLKINKLIPKITNDLEELKFIPSKTSSETIKITHPKISTIKTLKLIYQSKTSQLKHNESIGLNGLAGTIIDGIYKKDKSKIIKGLHYLRKLKISNVDAWYMSLTRKIINPYVNDGIAGMLLAIDRKSTRLNSSHAQ